MAEEEEKFSQRHKILLLIFIIMFLILLSRLWQLQIVKGKYYRKYSEENRIWKAPLMPARGVIYDRKGRALATNRLAMNVCIVPVRLPKDRQERVINRLAAILQIDAEEIRDKMKNQEYYNISPVLVQQELDIATVTKIEESSLDLPGVKIILSPVRYYPYGKVGAHLLGYVREISKRELSSLRKKGYRQGDRIGKGGVERYYDAYLHGVPGAEQVEIDGRGRPLHTLGIKPPKLGKTLILTIDNDIQKAAEEALGIRHGAIVVMNPQNGEVLALVSSPRFDPNILSGKIPRDYWKSIQNNITYPLENRTIKGLYEPGSVFKIITAIAALQKNKVSEYSHFYCSGIYRIGKWSFHCWRRGGHGYLDFLTGIAQSCNVMFYNLGSRVGPKGLKEVANKFGLGSVTGIDLPDEQKGLIPSPEWKRKRRHLPWYPGDTLHLAIGQGDVLVTPLQAASVVCAVANGGTLLMPRIVRLMEDSKGNILKTFSAKILRNRLLSPLDYQLLREGLRRVVAEGTARLARSRWFEVAGKTGTAQNPHGRSHAWFAGFAPVDNPQVVVVVFVEQGGAGGSIAGPIAKRSLKPLWQGIKYFLCKKKVYQKGG